MKHRRWFLELLHHVSKVYKAEFHAYCLMSNHYHLLVCTLEANLPDVMQYLDSVFTKRINKDMSRDGPVLRGRYKAILVDKDVYLLPLSRDIHLNPFEAGLAEYMNNHLWTSLPYYIGEKPKLRWIHTDFIEGYFENDNFTDAYKDYVAIGNDSSITDFYKSKKLKPILGSKIFIKSLKIKKWPSKEISTLKYCFSRLTLAEILNIVCKISGQSPNLVMRSYNGRTNVFRKIFISGVIIMDYA
ncbi:MAG: transposase [Pseudomonadota bacterium]|nr:transposase [Pseudomonadota bacterium]